jgi:hypothetical protein
MTFEQALVMIMLAMITKEAPGIKRNDKRLIAYEKDIAHMVAIDKKVVGNRTDLFMDPRVSRLFLGSVRFSEARFKAKPKDGDCRSYYVDFNKQIRARKKAGKKIPQWMYTTTRKSCPAKGPMQITQGPHNLVGRYWAEGKALKLPKTINLEQLRDPEMNVRLGYAIHWHWKVEAEKKLAKQKRFHMQPPPGVWFAAYRRGRLTGYDGWTGFRLDHEARARCKRMTHMMKELEKVSKLKGSKFSFEVPKDWWCGNETPPSKKPVFVAKRRTSSRKARAGKRR